MKDPWSLLPPTPYLFMIRNFLVVALLASFALSGTAHAESRSANVSTTTSATMLSCIKSAVTTRENSLYTAITAHHTTVAGLYANRKSDLPTYYNGTYTSAQIKEKLKSAWSSFRSHMKEAKKTWNTSQRAAWKKYRDDVKACRATNDITDERNSSSEAKGS